MMQRDSNAPAKKKPKKIGVTVRLDEATHQKVVKLAERQERSVAFIVDRALRDILVKSDTGQLDLDLD
ncbi:hypothetical protein [Aestuariivirga sp.]|uniref:hypothetical protein n=1 Tax=Aestuariivirga sp. TaxID=2650926 RepID=UPI0025C5C6AC|nr:hypothetical protein [Aestuariivirga sp.]MCA3554808.1 hypothetical protein [Aestuariivirga sp.]